MANNNFTSYNDKTGSSYNGTDLKQLNFETNVIKTTKDPVSGLESVVLSGGPFSYSSESYINASISDFRKVPTSNLTNTPFPVRLSSGGSLDLRIPTKSDYFIIQNSFDIVLEAKLLVRNPDGSTRNVQASDCLVPNDSLMPVKNVRPFFDGKPTIPDGKAINQRHFNRVLGLITEEKNRDAKDRRIKSSRTYYENEKTLDNRDAKTHSHIWKQIGGKGGKTIQIKTKSDPAPKSSQNIALAKSILEEFQFHLDLRNVEPFSQSMVYSRPCEQVYLKVEFCNFEEWLRVSMIDITIFIKSFYL